ncbi:MAG: response regulator transcription factor [Massilia sp.]
MHNHDGVRPGPAIALVEDDPSLNRATARLLRAQGFTVDSFASAEAFLARETGQPACLVLDIDLGGMSGLCLQRLLRTQGDATPIIFVTGGEHVGARELALDMGCTGFLYKPFTANALLELVLKALS